MVIGDYESVLNTPSVGNLLDRWSGGQHQALPLLLFAMVFGSVILKNVFRYYAVVYSFDFVRKFSDRLRCKIFERYLMFGKLYHDSNNSGHLYQVLMGMTERIAIELKAVESAFNAFILLLVYAVVMFWISFPLALISILAFPVIYISLKNLTRNIKARSDLFAGLYLNLGAKIANVLNCMPFIKSQGSETWEQEQFVRASTEARDAQFNIDKKQALNAPIQEVIMILVICLVVGMVMIISKHSHHSDMAGYMVFLVLLRRASTNLTVLGNVVTSFASVSGPIHEVNKVFNDTKKYFVPSGTNNFEGLSRSIQIKDLHYGYPNGSAVLNGVTATFLKGTNTALVGSSGGGKTTLINVLMRFYDTSPGTIYVDGKDIRSFKTESLISKIALVSQETYLFNESLKHNLIYGLQNTISDKEILTAMSHARIDHLATKHPEGLDVVVGDRGVKLSGGERQRISIARAILKRSDIVILDEATSSLDSVNEQLIQEALQELVRGKTTIVIAHRLATIQHADNVIVLEGGRIVEEGAPQELLQKKGVFHRYWQAQAFY